MSRLASRKQTQEAIKSKVAYLKQIMGLGADNQFSLQYDSARYESEAIADTNQKLDVNNRIEYKLLQTEKNLLEGKSLAGRGKLLHQIQLLNHRIEDLRLLQDLELRGDELRVVGALAAGSQNLHWAGIIQFHFHRDLGEIFLGEKIDRDPRRNHDQEERQQDQPHAELDYPPVVKEVQFDFVGFVHKRGRE